MGFDFGRKALGLALFGFILAGCGGAQSVTSAVPSGAIGPQGHRGSWMKPEASGSDLLYVSDGSDVYVYSYPSESLVGTLTGFYYALGVC
jgi:hypothetical protein